MPEHGHDRLEAGAAFGELGADGVPEPVRADRRTAPRESTSPAAVQAAFSDRSNRNALRQQLAADQEDVLHRAARRWGRTGRGPARRRASSITGCRASAAWGCSGMLRSVWPLPTGIRSRGCPSG